MLNKHILLLVASAIGFIFPVAIVVAINWETARPYFVVDGKTAKGRVIYLYAPG